MPIIAKESEKKYVLCPAGVHHAVCCDVVDLGIVKVTYNGKEKAQHKVRVVWQIDEKRDDGGRYTCSRRYTLSLDEKAALRKDLESWRGRAFTKEELAGFDLEKLIGVNCQVNIIHEQKGEGTYDNVTSVMPLGKGMPKIAPEGYVRVKDRKPDDGSTEPDGPGITDDDVPF